MNIEQATIVEILPTEVWYEKDFFGTVHIKMQHQGMEPFTFIQMHYDYMYTSNGHQHTMVKEIGKLLGQEDIQPREWVMPESWKQQSKRRDEIITEMCYTMRHDYGLEKREGALEFEAGTTEQERKALWNQMAQIFDNNIAPNMELRK